MSYQSQAALAADSTFNQRSQAAATEQAEIFADDARPDWVALALAVLRGELDKLSSLTRANASGPGVGDQVDPDGDGTIDQALVTDADLLALTQANWPKVATAYYDADGASRA